MTHEQELISSLKEINLFLSKFLVLLEKKGFENKQVLRDLNKTRERLEKTIRSLDMTDVDFGAARLASHPKRGLVGSTYHNLRKAAQESEETGEPYAESSLEGVMDLQESPSFFKKKWLKWVGAVALFGTLATAITVLYNKMSREKSLRELRKPISDLVATCEDISDQILELLKGGGNLDPKTKASWLELEACFYEIGLGLSKVNQTIR